MIILPFDKNMKVMSEKTKEIVRIVVQFVVTMIATVCGINL